MKRGGERGTMSLPGYSEAPESEAFGADAHIHVPSDTHRVNTAGGEAKGYRILQIYK